jgi:hypothetical protein
MIMMADLTIEDKQAISVRDRQLLRQYERAPLEWMIFLCRADVPVEDGQYHHTDAFQLIASERGNTVNLATNLVTTFVLGKLCVHALTLPPYAYQGYTGVRLVRLWPSPGHALNLLESSLLTPTKILQLGASFRKFNVNC